MTKFPAPDSPLQAKSVILTAGTNPFAVLQTNDHARTGEMLGVLNNYFDAIYVLTIPQATERQREFAASMPGLKYRLFYGQCKQDVDVEQLSHTGVYDDNKAKEVGRYPRSMSPGEIACAWGHRNIYQDIVDNKVKRALIFEDDAFPLKNKLHHLPEMLTALPPDWQLAYFDYNKNERKVPFKQWIYHLQHALGLLRISHDVINNLYPRDKNRYWKTAGFHDYTNAYAVTGEAATILLSMQTPLVFRSDNLLAHAAAKGQLNSYIATPRIFSQHSESKLPGTSSLIERGGRS